MRSEQSAHPVAQYAVNIRRLSSPPTEHAGSAHRQRRVLWRRPLPLPHRGGELLFHHQAPWFLPRLHRALAVSSSLSIKPKPNTLQPSLIAVTPSSTDRIPYGFVPCLFYGDSASAPPLPQNEMPKVAFSAFITSPSYVRRDARYDDRATARFFHACRHFLSGLYPCDRQSRR